MKLVGAVLVTVLVISMMLFASGCAQKAANETKATNESNAGKSDNNIVQTLNNEHYVALVKLVSAAGLEETLAKEGPYTIFAPTDKAFAAFPASTVQALMNNKTELNTDFRQPFMFHQKIHNFSSKPDDQYCFLKNVSL